MSSSSSQQHWCTQNKHFVFIDNQYHKVASDSFHLTLQAFDSSALGGGVGGGGIMGRDADQSNMKSDGPPSGASNDPSVS